MAAPVLPALGLFVLAGPLASRDVPPVYPGAPYPAAQAALLRAGWTPVQPEPGARTSPDHDELVCGEGYQASCSATFRRDDRRLCISLDATVAPPVVSGASEGEC